MRIFYFDLDCVRPDHLGVYGYNRETSPIIDELAQDAVVFNRCYASDTPCLPSRAALFTARPGIANGVISHEWPGCNMRFPATHGHGWNVYPEYKMPMRLLQENGYHTATFSIFAQRHVAWWFNAGFSEILNPTKPTSSEESESVNPRVLKWIKDNIHQHEDLFVHINYWDVHTPYTPKQACRDRVAQHPLPDFPDEAKIKDDYENFYGPKSARDIQIRNLPDYKSRTPFAPDEISNRDDFKMMMDSYDGCVATIDQALGEIIALLKEEGVYEDTAIIISADHGEAIGQMGMYFEHGVAVDAVGHVPLIIRWPGLTEAGGHCEEMVYQYDFMATVMDLLEIEQPSLWSAQSLLPALQGDNFEGHPYVVYGCGIFALQRAVQNKDYALVKTFHPGCSPLDDLYLFDMQADPNQSQNIAAENPTIVAQMEALYAEWWQGWCTGPNAVVDPMHLQTPDFSYFPPEQMFRRLEYLGRTDQIADLEKRLQTTRRRVQAHPAPESRY